MIIQYNKKSGSNKLPPINDTVFNTIVYLSMVMQLITIILIFSNIG